MFFRPRNEMIDLKVEEFSHKFSLSVFGKFINAKDRQSCVFHPLDLYDVFFIKKKALGSLYLKQELHLI